MTDSLAYLVLGIAITFLSAGQIAQKVAAQQIFGGDGQRSLLVRILTSPAIWTAAVLLAAGTLFWLLTLAQLEVSKAYPILSLSFVVTTVLARFFLGETVNGYRWLGVALISLGAAMMAIA
jgi:undecaprenyl phosphate-alpha-L-ara4N flippase subunit ArnE